jgi:hypothetical protein
MITYALFVRRVLLLLKVQVDARAAIGVWIMIIRPTSLEGSYATHVIGHWVSYKIGSMF